MSSSAWASSCRKCLSVYPELGCTTELDPVRTQQDNVPVSLCCFLRQKDDGDITALTHLLGRWGVSMDASMIHHGLSDILHLVIIYCDIESESYKWNEMVVLWNKNTNTWAAGSALGTWCLTAVIRRESKLVQDHYPVLWPRNEDLFLPNDKSACVASCFCQRCHLVNLPNCTVLVLSIRDGGTALSGTVYDI